MSHNLCKNHAFIQYSGTVVARGLRWNKIEFLNSSNVKNVTFGFSTFLTTLPVVNRKAFFPRSPLARFVNGEQREPIRRANRRPRDARFFLRLGHLSPSRHFHQKRLLSLSFAFLEISQTNKFRFRNKQTFFDFTIFIGAFCVERLHGIWSDGSQSLCAGPLSPTTRCRRAHFKPKPRQKTTSTAKMGSGKKQKTENS